jgi:hypothetical protein
MSSRGPTKFVDDVAQADGLIRIKLSMMGKNKQVRGKTLTHLRRHLHPHSTRISALNTFLSHEPFRTLAHNCACTASYHVTLTTLLTRSPLPHVHSKSELSTLYAAHAFTKRHIFTHSHARTWWPHTHAPIPACYRRQ